jgi:ribosomal protection tetracycline resistance protein
VTCRKGTKGGGGKSAAGRRALPGLTRGEGVVEPAFDSYRPVRGAPPSRSRTDADPLDRKEYLLRVVRRV